MHIVLYNFPMDSGRYTLSHFLRRSGEVLEAVDDGTVVLTRRDGEDLVLDSVSRVDALRAALELLAELALEAIRATDVRRELAVGLGSTSRWTAVLSQEERARLLQDVARAAAEASGHGSTRPLIGELDRWRCAARIRAERPISAHLTRPVAIPDDVDDPSFEKESGTVELPLHVRWSHPPRSYDLDDPRQRRLVYEQVLSEGLDDDVRRFVDVDTLVADWDELVLPARVRRAWADWLLRRRHLVLAC